MARGPGFKLKGRDKDRVLSEYMEMLAAHHPGSARLPGSRRFAGLMAALSLIPLMAIPLTSIFPAPNWLRLTAIGSLALIVLVSAILFTAGVIGPRRRLWWASMRTCGHDVCVVCGYWLEQRSPTSRACPECGTADADQPVKLGVRSAAQTWPRFEIEPPATPSSNDTDRP